MAAKINKTVKISYQNGSNVKNQMGANNPWHGGASQTGLVNGVKRRGGASPSTGSGYGTAKGIGGGATSKTGNSDGDCY